MSEPWRWNREECDAFLNEMLGSITFNIGELLKADAGTIFILDRDRADLWSLVPIGYQSKFIETRIPANQGIVGEVVQRKPIINLPFGFDNDSRLAPVQNIDRKRRYWKASFDSKDRELIEAFNIEVGVAVKKAKRFEALLPQEE